MYRIAGSSLSLIVAASVCSLSAHALAPLPRSAESWAHGDAAAICVIDAHVDHAKIDHPTLLAAYTGESDVTAHALPTDPGGRGPDSSIADAAPPDTVLSLMQPGPRPPKVAARTVDNERPEDWMRTAERPIPEPGLWAVLVAGFLGVCAMARRRIFSS